MTDDRRRLLLYGAGLSGAVVLAVVVILLVTTGGGSSSAGIDTANASSIAKKLRADGCAYKQYAMPPPHGDMHVTKVTAKPAWVTHPPSGGQHYYTPAPFNYYTDAVTPVIATHNLEHGGVVIWVGTKVSDKVNADVKKFYDEDPVALLVTPYKGEGLKPTQIALSAWTGDPARYQRGKYYGEGHFALCTTFNEQGFKTFRDAFRGKGPERFPMSALGPNQ